MWSFILKYVDKAAYLIFLILLDVTFLFIRILHWVVRLIPRNGKKKDLILYPYAFVGSDGYIRRFEEYIPFLEKNNITYRICNLYRDDYVRDTLARRRPLQYLLYLRILWKRIPQVLAAAGYKAAFIQRGLFPMYFDLEFPHLERLLLKINHHVTIDIWDSIFERQPLLVSQTIKYAHQLSVSNEFLKSHFQKQHDHVITWKVAVNLEKYIVKTDYEIRDKPRLFWTGLTHNLPLLQRFLPLIAEVSGKYPLTVVLVCKNTIQYPGLDIEHHKWEPDTFFNLLSESDIGIYPEFESIISKGKSTMKVMDYLATGLPMVGVPYGLPSEVSHGKELLIAHDYRDWQRMLETLLQEKELRRTLGQNGRRMVENYYSLDNSFNEFISFALLKTRDK
ncbi:MAG: glycosyltransferase [Bacteroidetes bacterium]|nr:glycosyltransferase [Bacteroidota bacterium]